MTMLGMLIQETNYRPSRERQIINLNYYGRAKDSQVQPKDLIEPKPAPVKVLPITPLQAQVAAMWCAGYSFTDIAQAFHWNEPSTAHHIIQRAKRGLKAKTIGQLTRALIEHSVKIPERRYVAPQERRRKPRIVSPLCQAVRACQMTNERVPYTIQPDDDVKKVQKWAWEYAKRYGFRIQSKREGGVVWLARRDKLA